MVELADTTDLGSVASRVQVRVLLSALNGSFEVPFFTHRKEKRSDREITPCFSFTAIKFTAPLWL